MELAYDVSVFVVSLDKILINTFKRKSIQVENTLKKSLVG